MTSHGKRKKNGVQVNKGATRNFCTVRAKISVNLANNVPYRQQNEIIIIEKLMGEDFYRFGQ